MIKHEVTEPSQINFSKLEERILSINNCLLNKSYVVATTNIENIKHADCYTTNDKSIGEIFLNNDKLYYYNGNVSGEELKYFVKNINNEFNNVLENIVEIN